MIRFEDEYHTLVLLKLLNDLSSIYIYNVCSRAMWGQGGYI